MSDEATNVSEEGYREDEDLHGQYGRRSGPPNPDVGYIWQDHYRPEWGYYLIIHLSVDAVPLREIKRFQFQELHYDASRQFISNDLIYDFVQRERKEIKKLLEDHRILGSECQLGQGLARILRCRDRDYVNLPRAGRVETPEVFEVAILGPIFLHVHSRFWAPYMLRLISSLCFQQFGIMAAECEASKSYFFKDRKREDRMRKRASDGSLVSGYPLKDDTEDVSSVESYVSASQAGDERISPDNTSNTRRPLHFVEVPLEVEAMICKYDMQFYENPEGLKQAIERWGDEHKLQGDIEDQQFGEYCPAKGYYLVAYRAKDDTAIRAIERLEFQAFEAPWNKDSVNNEDIYNFAVYQEMGIRQMRSWDMFFESDDVVILEPEPSYDLVRLLRCRDINVRWRPSLGQQRRSVFELAVIGPMDMQKNGVTWFAAMLSMLTERHCVKYVLRLAECEAEGEDVPKVGCPRKASRGYGTPMRMGRPFHFVESDVNPMTILAKYFIRKADDKHPKGSGHCSRAAKFEQLHQAGLLEVQWHDPLVRHKLKKKPAPKLKEKAAP